MTDEEQGEVPVKRKRGRPRSIHNRRQEPAPGPPQIQIRMYPNTPDFGFVICCDKRGMPIWVAAALTPVSMFIAAQGVAFYTEEEADAFQSEVWKHRVEETSKQRIQVDKRPLIVPNKYRRND